MRRAAALLALFLLAGCGSDEPAVDDAEPQSVDDRASAVLGGVKLELEVADEPAERAVGLMRRTSVPDGTGMVFLFDEAVSTRFYMYDVPIPLKAVFIRDGAVVSSVVMPPCEESEPRACPTYGADGPFDTVVETAPATLPDVQPGDRFELGS